MKPSTRLKLLFPALLLSPLVADALEIPQVKPGLWELRIQSSTDGTALKPTGTTQICWDAATLAESARKVEAARNKQDCSKYEVRKDGARWIANGICKSGGSIVNGQMTREFFGDNAYRDENTSTYDPPSRGNSRRHMIVDGKWLGPC